MLTLPAPTSYSALTATATTTTASGTVATTTSTAASSTTLRQPHPTHALAHPTSHGRSHSVPPNASSFSWPLRLRSLDLTRCHQIGKEMVQWLRLYVDEVKCETFTRGNGSWQES
jgi:hypothetical protein